MECLDYCKKHTLVLGVGNIMFGDDGFGPDVADYLNKNYRIPENKAVYNLGLSTRGFIFNILLSDTRPKRLVIVDAVSYDHRAPGELFDVPLDSLTREKVDDFSFHQGPTSNLLKELRDMAGMEIVIIACQPESIPREMTRGLSEPLKKCLPKAAEMIYNRFLVSPE